MSRRAAIHPGRRGRILPILPDPPLEVTDRHFCLFVSTTLVNPLNTRAHWTMTAARVARQREATKVSVWGACLDPRGLRWRIVNRRAAKRIDLRAHVMRRFDSHDNLRAACKPIVDGLIDARVIADDADVERHVFTYTQIVDGRRGVTIRVALVEEPA